MTTYHLLLQAADTNGERLRTANLPQSFSVDVGSFGGGGGISSSSFGTGAPPNKDRKMQSAEHLVFALYNPNLRENTLLELFKVYILLTLDVYFDILD
ncbi:hypothetical protein H5410_049506 [Solanum commersonii]|uniref:Uncharacterized protein n=1 Tax=Solanum commersonii TaxID=4109 RepID=A0A9J5WU95_SOLCO|nr:hypothetical protein H5410_049506 [Solanum commersonii]